MKRLIVFIAILFSGITVKANHINGYEMSLTRLSNTDTYKLIFKLYGENSPSSNSFPTQVGFEIFSNSNNASTGISINATLSSTYLSVVSPTVCSTPDANSNLKVGIYEGVLTSSDALTLINPSGYYIRSYLCCRTYLGINLSTVVWGMVITMDIPRLGINSSARYNSSPRFKTEPVYKLILGNSYQLDCSAIDPNKDSLSYKIARPLDGVSNNFKPYNYALLSSGYKLDSNIANGNPDFSINPQTGMVSYRPMMIGRYTIAIIVEEFRAGIKIGEIRREFDFIVVFVNNIRPKISDINNRKVVVTDSVNYLDEYVLNLHASDSIGDSIFVYALTNPAVNENLLNAQLFNTQFGLSNNLQSGNAAQNLVLKGATSLSAQFRWKPKCKDVRDNVYTISFVVRDNTCPTPLADTFVLNIVVVKNKNNSPMFIYPDTIRNSKTIKYYINSGETFAFRNDSALIAVDPDSTNFLRIVPIGDSLDGFPPTAFFKDSFTVSSCIGIFIFKPLCGRIRPYHFTFMAIDDDCKKSDTVFLNIEIYVAPYIPQQEKICGITMDNNSQNNMLFWKRTDPLVTNYIIYKQNITGMSFDSIAFIPASIHMAFTDQSSSSFDFETYRIVGVDDCGTKSEESSISNSIFLKSSIGATKNINLTWNAYFNAEPNDSFIIEKANCASPGIFTELVRLPITQLSYIDTQQYACDVYHRIELKTNTNCIGSGVTNPRVFSNTTAAKILDINNKNRQRFKLSPNPTSSSVYIEGLPSNFDNNVSIYSIQGQLLKSIPTIENNEIDISEFNPGVYLIKINDVAHRVVKL